MDDNELYDGSFGLMYYNRRKQHKNTTRDRDEEEWILAIGEHDGFVAGEIFVRVQYKLNKNKNTALVILRINLKVTIIILVELLLNKS